MRVFNFIKVIIILVSLFSVAAYAETNNAGPAVYTQDKPAAMVTAKNPEFIVKLKSNRTTGYSWFLRSYDRNLIEAVKHVYEAPENKKLMGAPGFEVWTFRVKPEGFTVPQQTAIRFIYARPWEALNSATQVAFKVTIVSEDYKK